MNTQNNDTKTDLNTVLNTNTTTSHALSIGEIFQQEREKLDLTVDTVANRLHLKKSIIIQLENNELPDIASTFVRGYIRSYAKLLGLEELPLLNLVSNEKPLEVHPPTPLQSYSIEKKKRRRDVWFKVFSGLIVFATVGVTGAWWLQNYQQDKKNQSPIEIGSPETTAPNTNQIPITQNTSATITEPSNNLPMLTNQSTPLPLNLNVNNANDLTAIPLGLPPTNEQALGLQTRTVEDAVNDTLALKSTEAASVEESTIADTATGIAIRFAGDCWVELIDASGKTLFAGIKKNGDELNFSEGAPFKIKLGAPSVVSIDFEGKPFDLSAFVKSGRVARFTLPLTE